jgi:hypothetical protein
LCLLAIPMFLQEYVIDRNRTPLPGEKQVPKCTAEAVDTRSVPSVSGLVQTGLSDNGPRSLPGGAGSTSEGKSLAGDKGRASSLAIFIVLAGVARHKSRYLHRRPSGRHSDNFRFADYTAKWPPLSEKEPQGAGLISEWATTRTQSRRHLQSGACARSGDWKCDSHKTLDGPRKRGLGWNRPWKLFPG